jgi:hypothetical protein
MPYAYTLGEVANMTPRQQLEGLKARLFPPKFIVGTGYIDARQVAIEYLEELIAEEREGE